MDSNGSRFLLMNQAEDFALRDAPDCLWNPRLSALIMAQQQELRLPSTPIEDAQEAWEKQSPLLMDTYQQLGMLSDDRRAFQFSLRWPAQPETVKAHKVEAVADSLEQLKLDPVDVPDGYQLLDAHFNSSGLTALIYSNGELHGLKLVHLRLRWQTDCEVDFKPIRVWVDEANQIWVAGDEQLALFAGSPLTLPYRPLPDRFEPVALNPNPLTQLWVTALFNPLIQPDLVDLEIRGLCVSDSQIFLLAWLKPDVGTDELRQIVLIRANLPESNLPITPYSLPANLPAATDIAYLDIGRLALLIPQNSQDVSFRNCDMAVVGLPAQTQDLTLALIQERYPQRSQAAVRFIRRADGKVRYMAADGPRLLVPLPQTRFPAQASILAGTEFPYQKARSEGGSDSVYIRALDAGATDTLWHRIYLEAHIPSGCRLTVQVRVANSPALLDASDWDNQSTPLWLPYPSELPYHQGLCTELKPDEEGLFEILLQRANGEVRELRGRYLQLRINLSGDGRHSPTVYALRVYYPRFSWQEAYLPDHFHQQALAPITTPDVSVNIPANAADVRQRLLAAFEGLLTPIEDRIAASEIGLYPDSMPYSRLNNTAKMLGGRLPSHWPESRQRLWLKYLGLLQQRRGTFGGLCLALDLATDGAVGRGQVIPVENFRLRRTFGTILGLNMDDAHHPLTLGTGLSGNSIVGDSLILSDENAREFLALLAPEIAATNGQDQAIVESFFDHYSHRLSIVLHGTVRAQRNTIEQVLAEQVPAHLAWSIIETEHPFVLGLSPLLGIDTYLIKQPLSQPVVADATVIGRGDLIQNPVALAPELARPTEGA